MKTSIKANTALLPVFININPASLRNYPFNQSSVRKSFSSWLQDFSLLFGTLLWIIILKMSKSRRSQIFFKIGGALKISAIFIGKYLCWSLFLIKAWKPATLLKKDSNTCIFLSILQNFWKQLFYRTPPDDCFWMLPFVKKMKQKIVANEASKTVESNSKKQKENPILRSCFHALFHPLTLFLEALWVSVWIWRRGRGDELSPFLKIRYAKMLKFGTDDE